MVASATKVTTVKSATKGNHWHNPIASDATVNTTHKFLRHFVIIGGRKLKSAILG
jgi:hypothetical protein